MIREQAILNAQMVMNYLCIYQRQAYISLDISRHDVRIHYFDMEATDDEVEKVEKELEALIMTGTEISFVRNEQINQLTFNIIWDLWK